MHITDFNLGDYHVVLFDGNGELLYTLTQGQSSMDEAKVKGIEEVATYSTTASYAVTRVIVAGVDK
jgi:hypothetical protein